MYLCRIVCIYKLVWAHFLMGHLFVLAMYILSTTTKWVFVFMSLTYVISTEVRDAYVINLQMPCKILPLMM